MKRLAVVHATALLGLLAVAACGPGSPGGPTLSGRMNQAPPPSRVVSTDILEREPRANRTRVKHILIGWRELEDSYGGSMDERARERTKAQAEKEVEALLGQIAGGADFDALMQQHSEDSGRTSYPDGYEVRPDAQLVLEFRRLGLRLDVDEIGVVESGYGFHIMKRVE